MPNISIGFGIALILLGIIAFVWTGSTHYTALIPTAFGAVMCLLGWLGRTATRRKHTMHAAAGVALVGLLGAFPGVIKALKWMGGTEPARPAAVISQTIMALLLVIFLILCIRSFIEARRARGSGA